MTKIGKNIPTSQSSNGSQNNIDELHDDRKRDVKIKVIDHRDPGYFIIDNLFVDTCFDVYTMAYYMRIVRRAHRSEKGFFELQKTTYRELGISESKLKQCNSLLEFCNIIKIKRRKDPKNPKIQISSVITLIDKSKWKLAHQYRDAGAFYELNRKPMKEELKLKIQAIKKKLIVDTKEKVDEGGLSDNPGWVTEKPRVGYLITPNEEHPIEEKTLLTIDAEKKIETQTEPESIQKETATEEEEINLPQKKNRKLSFKKAKPWNETSEDKKLNLLLNMACDAHRLGVKQKLFSPFDFDLFPTLLKPFFEKYHLDLIYDFYNYAKDKNAEIDVRNSEKIFLLWQERKQQPPATPAAPAAPATPAVLDTKEVHLNKPDIFEDLSGEVKDYLNKLSKAQKNHHKRELQDVGKNAFEKMILNIINRDNYKKKFTKKIHDINANII